MRAATGVAPKKVPERFSRTARAAPPGADPPVGQSQFTSRQQASASTRGLRPRVCLRKGCARVYQPRRWNQRYCQDPECLKEVRRWQNAQRQERRRHRPEVRQQHAVAERQRRARQRQARAGPGLGEPPPAGAPLERRAWSRRRKMFSPFCHRPGCYEPLPQGGRVPAWYCGFACREPMQRVLDRERKWLRRKRADGRRQGGSEDQARRPGRSQTSVESTRHAPRRKKRPP